MRFDSCGKLGRWIGTVQILQGIYRLDGNLSRTSDGWIIRCIRGFLAGSLTDIWQVALLVLWLASLVLLAILFVYDLRWLLLPDVINIPFIILGAIFAGIKVCLAGDFSKSLMTLFGSIAILSGIYMVLYLFSKYRYGEDKTWIGFGDVKLGLGLALFLGNWLLAFAALFIANLIGTLLVLPSMMRGKLQATSRICFGPLLIVGFLLAWFFSRQILEWGFLIV